MGRGLLWSGRETGTTKLAGQLGKGGQSQEAQDKGIGRRVFA